MRRDIKFGGCSALVEIEEGKAILTVWERSLPLLLADSLNESEGVDVVEVRNVMGKEYRISMNHFLPNGELLNIVCEAISQVYDVDTSVSYARS